MRYKQNLTKMENKSISKLAAVVIAGAAAGAVAWYFMKSEKGKDNWSSIVDAVKDFSDKLQHSAAENKEKLTHISEKASDYLSSKAKEASKFAENHIEDISAKAAQKAKSLS